MKTLSEIIDICKQGKLPTLDEARLAVCVLDSLLVLENIRLSNISDKSKDDWNNYQKFFNRFKNALGKTPVDYLGPEYNPDNPDVQHRRNVHLKMFNKIINNNKQSD